MVHGRSDLVDVTLALHHETPKAYLLSETGTGEQWVAKAHVECEPLAGKFLRPDGAGSKRKFQIVTATMPGWLAAKQGWV